MITADPKNRQITLSGQITDETANKVIAQMLFYQMEDPGAPVKLFIDSHGGSITATLAILDTMAFVKTPFHTYGSGCAHGCALLILASGTKGHRVAHPDIIAGLCRTEITRPMDAKIQQFVARLDARIIDLLCSLNGESKEQVAKDMENELQFSPPGLMSYGLIDRIDTLLV